MSLAVPERPTARTRDAVGGDVSIEIDLVTNSVVVHPSEALAGALVRPSGWCRYRGWRLAVKRCIDRAVAGVAVCAALPVIAAVAVAVRVTSRGPVVFRQQRVGRHGELFTIYKFRTMYRNAELRLRADQDLYQRYLDNDFKLNLDEDIRVTRLGRFLRRTSLDELPQLFNILAGHMSFVGPRPVVPDELSRYEAWLPMYLEAHPGLTGPWQANGRNEIRYPERAVLDADYIEHWSLRTDLKILAATVPAVLTRRGSE